MPAPPVENIKPCLGNAPIGFHINLQIETISKELAKYRWDSDEVKILLSMTGIDVFSAMLIATEIVDVKRFCTPWNSAMPD